MKKEDKTCYSMIGSMGEHTDSTFLGVCYEGQIESFSEKFKKTWRTIRFSENNKDISEKVRRIKDRQNALLSRSSNISAIKLLSVSSVKRAEITKEEGQLLRIILDKMAKETDNNIRLCTERLVEAEAQRKTIIVGANK